MARNQSPLVNWSQYLALRGVAALMQSFPTDQNLHTAGVLGSWLYRSNRARRERAELNLALSFPDWPRDRIARTVEASMQHMMQLFMVDSFAMLRLISPAGWPQYVCLKDIQPLLEGLIQGQPMILLTGHVGNWELLGHFLSLMGYPVVALARPLDNPLINRWLLGLREASGTTIVTKWGATPILQETLVRGGRVGFIADQNAGDQGLFVPFFGRLASSYKSIGLLAMRYEVPIIAGFARRVEGRMTYELSVVDRIMPDDWADQPDPLFYITARYNRAMEIMVREAPEQYLWLHRRWKSRPKFEREGRPVPKRLHQQLESLPWMTQEELDLIIGRSTDAAKSREERRIA